MVERPVSLFSGLALEHVFKTTVLPAFAEHSGHTVAGTYEPTRVLVELIGGGGRPEVMIGVDRSLRDLAAGDHPALSAESITPLVKSGLGLAVSPGSAAPTISTKEQFVSALLNADHVAYSQTGASGEYFAHLIEKLGIAEQVNETACVVTKGFVAETLLDGRADIAVQQLVELATVAGIQIVGAFPPAVQHYVELSAGLSPSASAQARELFDYLFSSAAIHAYLSVGLEPSGRTK